MNFTREPIIETVITPRDGCKLVIRSSKGNGQEDYFVDAVEVVSFGHSFFFRSLERPKSFLVPMSDYEVLELKETRMVLKNASPERSIKIGGGREAAPPRQREVQEEKKEEKQEDSSTEQTGVLPIAPGDRKRDKRRRSRRSGRDRHEPSHEMRSKSEQSSVENREGTEEEVVRDEPPQAPSFISKLFPPPPTLIKETLSRYKTAETVEQDIFVPPPPEEKAPNHYDESVFDHPISDEETKGEE